MPDVAFTFATAHNRSQPSATVRNRPHAGSMAMPMVKFAKEVAFGGFNRRAPSFASQAWHFLTFNDIQTCFVTGHRWFLCGKCNAFATFSEDALHS